MTKMVSGLVKCAVACLLVAVFVAIPACRTDRKNSDGGATPVAAAEGSPAFRRVKLSSMDSAVQSAVRDGMIPGGVLWLENKGRTYQQAYGLRSVEPVKESMTPDTIFDAASLTKVLAATPAVLLLVERGKLKLDDEVSRYIPEFTGGGKELVTLRQLLTHTSGLRPDVDTRTPWKGEENAIRLACAERLASSPGTTFRYSDINFFLLGEVVRRVGGRGLDEFLRTEIYQPLKMKDTGFRPRAELLPRVAPTERIDGVILRGVVHDPTARFMGGVAGHAGLFTTAADIARFARMMLNGGELNGVRVFRPETVQMMTAVQTPDGVGVRRGLGWDIDSGYSRPRGKWFPLGSYGHTGFTGTSLWIDPFSRTFWIFLSNRVHPDGKGNVLPLQAVLADLAAEAVEDYNFVGVSGALAPRSAGNANAIQRSEVLNGIDVLVRDGFKPLKGKRIGLVTNHTGQDRNRAATIDLLHQAEGVKLVSLFSPEHGLRGVQDEKVGDGVDAKTALPIHSLYGERRAPSMEQLKGLDALVFDIQDIGCRFYTYISTLGLCLEAAAKAGIEVVVLDRVNPINGRGVEGPVYLGPSSFIAFHKMPVRHGMTVGELARLFNSERKWGARLNVVGVEGWSRARWYDETGLPWTNPSPNMRTLGAALLYPGVGLLETAISVGRGTDTPFEIVGAPYVDDIRWAGELNKAGLPGVRFIPARFTPRASVFKDQPCGGVQILITDRESLHPLDVGLLLASTLQKFHPGKFALNKLNTLLLDAPTLEGLREGKGLEELRKLWDSELAAFRLRREAYLLYR